MDDPSPVPLGRATPFPDLAAAPIAPGGHVRIAPLTSADFPALWAEGAGAADLWRWLPAGPFASPADLSRDLEPFVGSAEHPTYAVIPEGTGPCGFAAYWRIDRLHGTVEIGNVLFAPRLQRTAAATEALVLMLRHAFGHGYRRVEWKCDSRNTRSRAAAERLGFVFEGRFRKHLIVKGERRDTDWLSIIDDDWPELDGAWSAWLAPENFDAEGRQRRSLAALTRAAHERIDARGRGPG